MLVERRDDPETDIGNRLSLHEIDEHNRRPNILIVGPDIEVVPKKDFDHYKDEVIRLKEVESQHIQIARRI